MENHEDCVLRHEGSQTYKSTEAKHINLLILHSAM